MILTLSGDPGSGKSTCARGLAAHFGLKHYSIGGLMRQAAQEKGMNLEAISREAEKAAALDHWLDDRQIELGRTEDDFVIDGRLSAHFIPHAVKIFLTATLCERARRVFDAGRSDEHFASREETEGKLKARQESEVRRYLKWYGVNPYDPDLYDIVLDTTVLPAEQVIATLVTAIQDRFPDSINRLL